MHSPNEAFKLISDLVISGDETLANVSELLVATSPTQYIAGLTIGEQDTVTNKVDIDISHFIDEGGSMKSLPFVGETELIQLMSFYNVNNFIAFGQDSLIEGVLAARSFDQLLRYRVVVSTLEAIGSQDSISRAVHITGYGYDAGGAISPKDHNSFDPDYQGDVKSASGIPIRGIGGVL